MEFKVSTLEEMCDLMCGNIPPRRRKGNMKYIKDFIRTNMQDYPQWKIEEYIYSFLQDGEISEKQYDNLIAWAEEFCKTQ